MMLRRAGRAGRAADGVGAARSSRLRWSRPRPFSDKINVLGVARGRRSVNITSNSSELITRVLFRDGQRVAAGTPLVQLQAREEDAGIIEARAQVGSGPANSMNATRPWASRGTPPG